MYKRVGEMFSCEIFNIEELKWDEALNTTSLSINVEFAKWEQSSFLELFLEAPETPGASRHNESNS